MPILRTNERFDKSNPDKTTLTAGYLVSPKKETGADVILSNYADNLFNALNAIRTETGRKVSSISGMSALERKLREFFGVLGTEIGGLLIRGYPSNSEAVLVAKQDDSGPQTLVLRLSQVRDQQAYVASLVANGRYKFTKDAKELFEDLKI